MDPNAIDESQVKKLDAPSDTDMSTQGENAINEMKKKYESAKEKQEETEAGTGSDEMGGSESTVLKSSCERNEPKTRRSQMPTSNPRPKKRSKPSTAIVDQRSAIAAIKQAVPGATVFPVPVPEAHLVAAGLIDPGEIHQERVRTQGLESFCFDGLFVSPAGAYGVWVEGPKKPPGLRLVMGLLDFRNARFGLYMPVIAVTDQHPEDAQEGSIVQGILYIRPIPQGFEHPRQIRPQQELAIESAKAVSGPRMFLHGPPCSGKTLVAVSAVFARTSSETPIVFAAPTDQEAKYAEARLVPLVEKRRLIVTSYKRLHDEIRRLHEFALIVDDAHNMLYHDFAPRAGEFSKCAVYVTSDPPETVLALADGPSIPIVHLDGPRRTNAYILPSPFIQNFPVDERKARFLLQASIDRGCSGVLVFCPSIDQAKGLACSVLRIAPEAFGIKVWTRLVCGDDDLRTAIEALGKNAVTSRKLRNGRIDLYRTIRFLFCVEAAKNAVVSPAIDGVFLTYTPETGTGQMAGRAATPGELEREATVMIWPDENDDEKTTHLLRTLLMYDAGLFQRIFYAGEKPENSTTLANDFRLRFQPRMTAPIKRHERIKCLMESWIVNNRRVPVFVAHDKLAWRAEGETVLQHQKRLEEHCVAYATKYSICSDRSVDMKHPVTFLAEKVAEFYLVNARLPDPAKKEENHLYAFLANTRALFVKSLVSDRFEPHFDRVYEVLRTGIPQDTLADFLTIGM